MSTTDCALIIENIIKQYTILSWLERKMSTDYELIIENSIKQDKFVLVRKKDVVGNRLREKESRRQQIVR